MTPKFRFQMVVIWDSCRVQQLNLLQHHASWSPTSWSNKYEGWIRVNQWISQFCHVQRRSLLSEYNSENGAFPSNRLEFFQNTQCFSHVWWRYGTRTKRKHGAFHPTIEHCSRTFTKTCNACRSEQGVSKGTSESETKIWPLCSFDDLYHGPDSCEFLRHGCRFFQCG